MRAFQNSAFCLTAAAVILASTVPTSISGDKSALQPFPTPFSSIVPGDINQDQLKEYTDAGEFAEAQRMFDIFAWQTFIALCWPANQDGTPDTSLTIGQTGPAGLVWEHWKYEFEVYTPNGMPPKFDRDGRRPRSLTNTGNTVPEILNESQQAFAAPLVDQNGNWVHYEVRMSDPEVQYLVENDLYYVQGQIEFHAKGGTVGFPEGAYMGPIGAIEIKAAWKQLESTDISERYYTATSDIIIDNPAVFSKKVVKKDVAMGLIGFHISAKTQFAKQWIWATFEQVDNLQTPSLEIDGKQLKPSLFNNDEPYLEVNQPPPMNAVIGSGTTPKRWDPTATYEPTQVMRVIPIPPDKRRLSAQVQAALAKAVPGNVWQYYELIDTQWPTNPNAPPTPPTPFNPHEPINSVTNKAGGDVVPAYLTNMTMETFFQKGNQPAYNLIQGMPQDSSTKVPIFGTESCVGCHYSGAIATALNTKTGKVTYGAAQSADFSWLLQQKAEVRQNTDN